MSTYKTPVERHFRAAGPKRILTLDGGGVRGVLTLGVLSHIERLLRNRHENEQLVLADYFDLIAGTSTGAIIAAALAKGMRVVEVQELYRTLASKIFQRTWFRQGVLRAKYDAAALSSILKGVFGEETLGSAQLETGLLVVMKRVDTGSPWPVSNNPNGRYYDPKKPFTIPNKDYPLWSVVRASTAAPSFFDPERIEITRDEQGTSVVGTFVDGGVCTANNPALLALRFATLKGYRVEWPTGENELLLISVGTGASNPNAVPSAIPGKAAIEALVALMGDCNAEVETMMQWLGRSNTAHLIDREIGSLDQDDLGGHKVLTYQRYNVELSQRGVIQGLKVDLSNEELEAVQEMDAPDNIPALEKIGASLGATVSDSHFPASFDLSNGGRG
jgi:uncharacterized protein